MKTALYRRVSTREQDDRGYSLPTQLDECQAYARRAGLQIVAEFSDDASGLTLDRPGLHKALAMLRSGQAGALLVHDDDRLTRSPRDSIILRDELAARGIALHYALQGEVDLLDVGDQISQDVRARVRADELRKLAERTQRGRRGKVNAGHVITAQRPPFGYVQLPGDDKTPASLAIDPDEAETVRLIFDLYIDEGLSVRQVAERLGELKRPTRADKTGGYKKHGFGHWAQNTVRNILKNETYTGVWHYGKTRRKTDTLLGKKRQRFWDAPRDEWIAVEVPAIISRERWEFARQIMSDKTTRKPGSKLHDYLLANRLTCATCAAPLYCSNSNSNGQRYFYYRCSSHHSSHAGDPCGQRGIRAEAIDTAAWAWLNDIIERKQLKQFAAERVAMLLDAIRDNGRAEGAVRRRIEFKERALGNLLKIYVEGGIEENSFQQARADLRQELTDLHVELEQVQALQLAEAPLERLLKIMDEIEQRGAEIGPNTPFAERCDWVARLDVRGVVDANSEATEFRCDLTRWGWPEESYPGLRVGIPAAYEYNPETGETREVDRGEPSPALEAEIHAVGIYLKRQSKDFVAANTISHE